MGKSRCLVLGGGGFIGSHLSSELLESGYDVTVFDKLNFSRKNISGIIDNIKIKEGDFNNVIEIESALQDADYVFHLVSSTLPASSNENPVYDVETNLISTLNLLERCVDKKIKKIVFISSGGTVYGIPGNIPITEEDNSNPLCSYGIVKKTIEEYLYMFLKLYKLEYFVFRLSNPYGERQNPLAAQGVIPVFINKVIDDQEIVIWGDGGIIRDYIYITDAVKVLSKSPEIKSEKKIFNLSSGKGYSLNDIVEMLKKISGKKVKVRYEEGRNIDVPVNILDNTRVKEVFKWKPETDIEAGMKRVYKYLEKMHAG